MCRRFISLQLSRMSSERDLDTKALIQVPLMVNLVAPCTCIGVSSAASSRSVVVFLMVMPFVLATECAITVIVAPESGNTLNLKGFPGL